MDGVNQDQMNRRVFSDLRNRSTHGLIFYPIAVLIVISSDGFYARHFDFCLSFLLSMGGICVLRLVHLSIDRWISKSYATGNQFILAGSVALTALIWGIFFARFMALEDEFTTQLLMAICSVGLSAGGVVTYVPSLNLSLVFNFFILSPAIVRMYIEQVNPHLVLAILIFSIYLMVIAYKANQEYHHALQNEFLLLKKSEELNTLSRIDVLTGLYNRRHFEERFAHEWQRSIRHRLPVTFIIGDIDHFKKINDDFGHQAGDAFLKLTARVLKESFRRATDLVARYGGEEFVVLCTDTDPTAAYEMAESLRQQMADISLTHNNQKISATISIGIATATPGIHDSRDTLMSIADKALYAAKQQGRNRTISDAIAGTGESAMGTGR